MREKEEGDRNSIIHNTILSLSFSLSLSLSLSLFLCSPSIFLLSLSLFYRESSVQELIWWWRRRYHSLSLPTHWKFNYIRYLSPLDLCTYYVCVCVCTQLRASNCSADSRRLVAVYIFSHVKISFGVFAGVESYPFTQNEWGKRTKLWFDFLKSIALRRYWNSCIISSCNWVLWSPREHD